MSEERVSLSDPKRIPLVTGLKPRDYTRSKDARSVNCFAEEAKLSGQTFNTKRAGLANTNASLLALNALLASPAQGIFGFVDSTGSPALFAVGNDILLWVSIGSTTIHSTTL